MWHCWHLCHFPISGQVQYLPKSEWPCSRKVQCSFCETSLIQFPRVLIFVSFSSTPWYSYNSYLWTGGLALDELQVKFTHILPQVLFVVAFVLKITAGLSKKRIEDLVSKWILHELNCSSWKLSTFLVRAIIRSK